MRFRHHVFICVNERPAAAERKSCGEAQGLELVKLFKKHIRERGLDTTIRAQRAGCLDACETGPTVVVYPGGVYYGAVTPADVPEIVESHLANGIPVKRLIVFNG
jgi:(2Fe-2S) ferredoxin